MHPRCVHFYLFHIHNLMDDNLSWPDPKLSSVDVEWCSLQASSFNFQGWHIFSLTSVIQYDCL